VLNHYVCSAVAAHGSNTQVRNAVNLSARTLTAHLQHQHSAASSVHTFYIDGACAVKLRIRATNNVAKITNVMKLVASSKLRAVEDALQRGKAFGEGILQAVAIKEDKKDDKKDEDSAQGVFLDDKKHLIVCVTTDRGLCGSVNSSLTRNLRKELNAAAKVSTGRVRADNLRTGILVLAYPAPALICT
jgi:hypothetical protein